MTHSIQDARYTSAYEIDIKTQGLFIGRSVTKISTRIPLGILTKQPSIKYFVQQPFVCNTF